MPFRLNRRRFGGGGLIYVREDLFVNIYLIYFFLLCF